MTTSTSKTKNISKGKISASKRRISEEKTIPFYPRLSVPFDNEKTIMNNLSPNKDDKNISFKINPYIIDKYKQEKLKTRGDLEKLMVNEILNDISMKEKYQKLIKQDFELPDKFIKLAERIFIFDKYLFNLLKNNHFNAISFSKFQKNIINLSEIKQILFLDNNYYIINKDNNNELWISLPDLDFENSDIKNILKYRKNNIIFLLIDYVKEKHFKFLKEKKIEENFIFYEHKKQWHKNFNLNEIDDIPEINDFIIQKKHSKSKIRQTNSEIEIINNTGIKEMIINSVIFLKIIAKNKIYLKVQNKEKQFEELLYFKNDPKLIIDKEKLKDLAQIIEKYFKIRDVTAMFFVNIIKYISLSGKLKNESLI